MFCQVPIGCTGYRNRRIKKIRSAQRFDQAFHFWENIPDRPRPALSTKIFAYGYPIGKPAMAPRRGRPKHTVSGVPKIISQHTGSGVPSTTQNKTSTLAGTRAEALGDREVRLALDHLASDRVVLF